MGWNEIVSAVLLVLMVAGMLLLTLENVLADGIPDWLAAFAAWCVALGFVWLVLESQLRFYQLSAELEALRVLVQQTGQ